MLVCFPQVVRFLKETFLLGKEQLSPLNQGVIIIVLLVTFPFHKIAYPASPKKRGTNMK